MTDTDGLCDRVYADAVGADLRMPGRFVEAKMNVAWHEIEPHVRERAEAHQRDLCLRPALMEAPFNCARKEWMRPQKCDGGSRRGVTRLVATARDLLQGEGRHLVLRVDRENPGREILRWRFVSLALPAGILVGAAAKPGRRPPEGVRVLHQSFAPDNAVAHHHVHHVANLSFEELWVNLRRRVLLKPSDLLSSVRESRAICPGLHPGTCRGGTSDRELAYAKQDPLGRGRHMAEWAGLLHEAFIAGRLLDLHEGHSKPLACCRSRRCRAWRARLRAFVAGRTTGFHRGDARYRWPEDQLREERKYRKALERDVGLSVGEGRAEWARRGVAEESRRLARAFAQLRPDEPETPDAEYEILLLQYLRVKTAVFRLLVYPPGEGGLRSFLGHFQQIKVYAPETDRVRPPAPSEPGLRVRACEYRVAPDTWFKTHRRHDPGVEKRWNGEGSVESAWLVHFKRTGAKGGLPRFGDAVRRMESEADDMIRALEAEPRYLRRLRGIDVCGVEGEQPLWVSAQTLRRVRQHSRAVAARRPGLRLEPLRLTVHVGEEFCSLTSGMRAVAEPFQWELIERGDRIGHGLALTLDPDEWFKRRRGEVLIVKRFDRLLDLAFLAVYASKPSDRQRRWLGEQIGQMVESLGLAPGTPLESDRVDVVEEAKRLWRSLGARSTRRLLTADEYLGEVRARRRRHHEAWMHRYLWRPSVQRRAAEEVRIPVRVADVSDLGKDDKAAVEGLSHERALLRKAHRALLDEVAHWQVCIESNPSSNLVVASLDSVAAQDFLARRPTQEVAKRGATLTWTISTDDPISFSTTLADEYAYAWAGLTMRATNPCDPTYARALLDEAAATSMRMRFTAGGEHAVRRSSKNREEKRGRPGS